MPSLSELVIPFILSFSAISTATKCPTNWLESTARDKSQCCYGNMVLEDRDFYCCVYAIPSKEEVNSVSTSSTDDSNYEGWSTAGSCFTQVPWTASDYSAQVSSASSKLEAGVKTISKNEATSTASATSSLKTTSGTSDETATGSSTLTSNAAAPLITAPALVLGGAAVLAGLGL